MTKLNNDVKSLLVADDDLDDLMLLLSAIETLTSEIDVSHVQDGLQLIAFLSANTFPDLILLDINMPKIDGIDCLKRIRTNSRFDHIPIIMYSTSSNLETIETCYQFGASRYIIKPYHFKDIVAFMKMILCVDWKASKMVHKEAFLLTVADDNM